MQNPTHWKVGQHRTPAASKMDMLLMSLVTQLQKGLLWKLDLGGKYQNKYVFTTVWMYLMPLNYPLKNSLQGVRGSVVVVGVWPSSWDGILWEACIPDLLPISTSCQCMTWEIEADGLADLIVRRGLSSWLLVLAPAAAGVWGVSPASFSKQNKTKTKDDEFSVVWFTVIGPLLGLKWSIRKIYIKD